MALRGSKLHETVSNFVTTTAFLLKFCLLGKSAASKKPSGNISANGNILQEGGSVISEYE